MHETSYRKSCQGASLRDLNEGKDMQCYSGRREHHTQAISRARALSPRISQDSMREAKPLCGRHWGSEGLKGELED